jgi:prolyl-tRNA synthetase
MAHEFMFLTPIGEDTLLLCDSCGFSANRQIAAFGKKALPNEPALPLEKVATPDCKTIETLANFLGVEQAQTAKAVFLIASVKPTSGKEYKDVFIFAIVRGDMEVNETKLANAVKARGLRPATEEEIRVAGAEPGYASPVGIHRNQNSLPVIVIVDDLIPESVNLVSGANEAGFHLRNVNYGRDFTADIVTDICAARDGDACPTCGSGLRAVRGVEVGNIFKLGTNFSDSMGCTYLAQNGQEKPVIMGSYGIGLGRLLACIAEVHHDEKGLCWPVSVAPYPVHIVLLAGKPKAGLPNLEQNAAEQTAEALYGELASAGLQPLYDDRVESPGVKFNDADLIGLPLRITVGERALQQGGVELKRRDREEKEIIPLDQVIGRVKQGLGKMQAEIDLRIITEAYK